MLNSQLEIIKQGQQYLDSVSTNDYCAILSPNFISSSGSHIRHIIDHYSAIRNGIEGGIINYDDRERGSAVETSTKNAHIKFTEIENWLKGLTEPELNRVITLSTEVSISNQNIQKVQTTVARELVFAGSHAVHHYAMIAQISLAQKTLTPKSFGIAPATATFLRGSNHSKPNDMLATD